MFHPPLSQLNSQAATVSASAATLAAGGPVPQNNQAWAPWPAHAWPASQTPNAQAALQVANTVQASDESMTDLLTQMQTQGCTMSCSQLEQLIQTMQGQESTVSAAGAAAATGGKPVPANNPAWAPWPAHSWPASQKPSTQAIQSMSNQVQATDDSMSAAWQQMQQQGC